jgi:uncharacterized membrane protein YhiD involved in acid resistance
VVTGISFLGAGVIVHKSGSAHDLTTAASIWATAAIGMTVATGAWLFAIGATVILWIVLTILHPVSRYIEQNSKNDSHHHGKVKDAGPSYSAHLTPDDQLVDDRV